VLPLLAPVTFPSTMAYTDFITLPRESRVYTEEKKEGRFWFFKGTVHEKDGTSFNVHYCCRYIGAAAGFKFFQRLFLLHKKLNPAGNVESMPLT
jgi:hypothetical protein